MKYRDADPRKLRTKLKVRLNRKHRRKVKKMNEEEYQPNSAMADALKEATEETP